MSYIKLTSIDECYDKLEYKFINELYMYDSLDKLDNDAHIILVKILMDSILNRINLSKLKINNSINGYQIKIIPDKDRPFVLFYFDENKINLNKEILEYHSIEEFVDFYKRTISVCNILSNNRILNLEFPFSLFKTIELSNDSKTDKEEFLISEIVTKYYTKKKQTLKQIKKKCNPFGITLTNLQERKILT